MAFDDIKTLLLVAAEFASLPFDFFVKVMGKSNFYEDSAGKLPIVNSMYNEEIIIRYLLLVSLTEHYEELWNKYFSSMEPCNSQWSKNDSRLLPQQLIVSSRWSEKVALRDYYSRRQALVEIDVLVAMSLGMTLKQLQDIYHIQFPVSQQYEADTWYDRNGQIVFTISHSMSGIGFERKEWEMGIKGAPAGKKFYRTITDDTMPGGPIERTIEYTAPFDRCDREKDYETAWKFFEEKYGKEN